LLDSRVIAPLGDDFNGWFAAIPPVSEQVHAASAARVANTTVKECSQLSDVMPVGAGDADRQRDPTCVDQDVSLASIFSPGPSGCARRTRAPAALSRYCRPRSATARRYPPSRHTRLGRLATGQGRTHPAAISGNTCVQNWHSRNALSGGPSIDNPCVARTRWPQTPFAVPSPSCPRQAFVGTADWTHAQRVAGSAVPLSSRIRPKPPRSVAFPSFPSWKQSRACHRECQSIYGYALSS
jgi:hypothetical protein